MSALTFRNLPLGPTSQVGAFSVRRVHQPAARWRYPRKAGLRHLVPTQPSRKSQVTGNRPSARAKRSHISMPAARPRVSVPAANAPPRHWPPPYHAAPPSERILIMTVKVPVGNQQGKACRCSKWPHHEVRKAGLGRAPRDLDLGQRKDDLSSCSVSPPMRAARKRPPVSDTAGSAAKTPADRLPTADRAS